MVCKYFVNKVNFVAFLDWVETSGMQHVNKYGSM